MKLLIVLVALLVAGNAFTDETSFPTVHPAALYSQEGWLDIRRELQRVLRSSGQDGEDDAIVELIEPVLKLLDSAGHVPQKHPKVWISHVHSDGADISQFLVVALEQLEDISGPVCYFDISDLHLYVQSFSVEVRFGAAEGACVFSKGEWRDYYTGELIVTDDEPTVDRVVSFDDAWASGASRFPLSRRMEFAHERGNLVVTSHSNDEDRDDDTIEDWLPDDDYIACDFIRHYMGVKRGWKLSFLEDEVDVIEDFYREEVESEDGRVQTCTFSGVTDHGLIFDSFDESGLHIRD